MARFCSILAGALLILVSTVACGGGGAAPATPAQTLEPAVTSTPRPSTATPRPIPTPKAPGVLAQPTPRCPDPYPSGAPYVPTPGVPIHLRPAGSPPALAHYTPLAFSRDLALEHVMKQTVGSEIAHFSVVVKNLDDGKGGTISSNRSFYAASLYKTWVMLEAFHQRDAGMIDFGEKLIVSDYYQSLGLNDGELQACDEVSIREALARAMSISDNVAANLVLDRVGVSNVNIALRGLGLNGSGFLRGMMPTTASDMELLMEAIARDQALGAASSGEMIDLLASETVSGRLPALLPAGTRVAHKTGSWDGATHDAGIVFSPKATYVIVVLTDYSYGDAGAGRIPRLSRAVYDYFNR